MIQAQDAWRKLKQKNMLPFEADDLQKMDQVAEVKEATDTADEDKVCSSKRRAF